MGGGGKLQPHRLQGFCREGVEADQGLEGPRQPGEGWVGEEGVNDGIKRERGGN